MFLVRQGISADIGGTGQASKKRARTCAVTLFLRQCNLCVERMLYPKKYCLFQNFRKTRMESFYYFRLVNGGFLSGLRNVLVKNSCRWPVPSLLVSRRLHAAPPCRSLLRNDARVGRHARSPCNPLRNARSISMPGSCARMRSTGAPHRVTRRYPVSPPIPRAWHPNDRIAPPLIFTAGSHTVRIRLRAAAGAQAGRAIAVASFQGWATTRHARQLRRGKFRGDRCAFPLAPSVPRLLQLSVADAHHSREIRLDERETDLVHAVRIARSVVDMPAKRAPSE